MEEPQDDVLITVSTSDAQNILIVVSAGLSFVKSLMAVGTYSYFHLVFSFLELACTGLAFSIFVLVDYQGEHKDDLYGDDVTLYLLSFASGIIVEWLDVLVTYQTVRTYKRLKDIKPRSVMEETKKKASSTYKCLFVLTLILGAIVPLIAFSKANWEPAYFGPADFSSKNRKLLLISIIITIVCQGIWAIFATLNATNPKGFIQVSDTLGKVLQLPLLPASVLILVVLANVSGREAGGLAYFSLINVIQGVESVCEIGRHQTWFQLEHPRKKNDLCGEQTVAVSIEEQLISLIENVDTGKTGFLSVEELRSALAILEERGILTAGAANQLIEEEAIDYRGTVKRILTNRLLVSEED